MGRVVPSEREPIAAQGETRGGKWLQKDLGDAKTPLQGGREVTVGSPVLLDWKACHGRMGAQGSQEDETRAESKSSGQVSTDRWGPKARQRGGGSCPYPQATGAEPIF